MLVSLVADALPLGCCCYEPSYHVEGVQHLVAGSLDVVEEEIGTEMVSCQMVEHSRQHRNDHLMGELERNPGLEILTTNQRVLPVFFQLFHSGEQVFCTVVEKGKK
ncbi:hypothetical protein WR25_15933 [Diploscapter pachys]|uniref:Uncharacterized protein n=1 Tax=Diploscapter pachys TaxID=2018661 RepID=A0A2A2JMC6_9BILA|nr:hypothetical protein WR25_15933 [Diploscapter pachys]